jgi:hypothetical protein
MPDLSTPGNPPAEPAGRFYLADPSGRVTGHVDVATPGSAPPAGAASPVSVPPAGAASGTGAVEAGTAASEATAGEGTAKFAQLVGRVNTARPVVRGAMAMSGTIFALAVDVAATANLGNPWLYYNRRDTWKNLSEGVRGKRRDVRQGVLDITDWVGPAKAKMEDYSRFTLDESLFSSLADTSSELSSVMHGVGSEVTEYDASVATVYATSAPVIRSMMALSAGNPMSTVMLSTYITAFAGTLLNLIKQLWDIYNKAGGDMTAIEAKQAGALKAAFWQGGDPSGHERDLALPQTLTKNANIADPDFWGVLPGSH